MTPLSIEIQLSKLFRADPVDGDQANDIIRFFIAEVERSKSWAEINWSTNPLWQRWLDRDFAEFMSTLDLSHIPALQDPRLANMISEPMIDSLCAAEDQPGFLNTLAAINDRIVALRRGLPATKLQPNNTNPGYVRDILQLLPFSHGVLISIEYVFPTHRCTPAHTHPRCIVEEILEGDLVELHFKPTHKHGRFQFVNQEVLPAGSKLKVFAEDRRPHAVYGKDKPCRTIATFVGNMPMQVIDRTAIDNINDIPIPFGGGPTMIQDNV